MSKDRHSATIVGGQPPRGWQRPVTGLPVGVERVLYTAATDRAFCEELLRDRRAALARLDAALLPSERTMIESIAEPQLRATIAAIDASAENVKRRVFLKAVAAAAAGAAVVHGASACTGTRPDEPDSTTAGDGGADALPVPDGPAPTGIRPG